MKMTPARSSDAVLAVFVLAVTAMLLIPVPALMIDVLLVVSFAFSLMLLILGLYITSISSLLVFPSLLLLTTLFRLSLNVASTRLILLDGYAGDVIQSFGNFLIRGEVIVGVIIFTIITIVNFIVVSRGSSRVAEVAARFALDALPGKQMAIDADMRSGLISAEEATRRRDLLRQESQLYGAMDGAMKFVQGDVIAGIFIIFTNILGGIYLGIRGGLGFGEALDTYTVLTVGDGLVSQIPALLVSICAGMVVTRVASEDRSATLGNDLARQLFANPFAMIFTGIVMFLLGVLPGLPFFPFSLGAAMFVGAGFWMRRRSEVFAGSTSSIYVGRQDQYLLGLDKRHLSDERHRTIETSPLVFELDAVLYRLYRVNIERYEEWWRELQRSFFRETGLRIPDPHVQVVADLPAAHCEIRINGATLFESTAFLDAVFVELSPDISGIFGLTVLERSAHPVHGKLCFWTPKSFTLTNLSAAAGVRSYDFLEYLGLHTISFYRKYPEELLRLTDVQSMVSELATQHPALVKEVLDGRRFDSARFTELLQQLAREGLNVRDVRQVLEGVASYFAVHSRDNVEEQGEFLLEELVNFIRLARRREFLAPYLSERRTLKVFTLSEAAEQLFEEATVSPHARNLVMSVENREKLLSGLKALLGPVMRNGVLPITVVCRADLKPMVWNFLYGSSEKVSVVLKEEIEPSMTVEEVGVWTV